MTYGELRGLLETAAVAVGIKNFRFDMVGTCEHYGVAVFTTPLTTVERTDLLSVVMPHLPVGLILDLRATRAPAAPMDQNR